MEEVKDLSKASPLLINMAITGRAGPVVSIRMELFVKTSTKKQSLSLMNMTSFFDQVKVSVEAHKSLNYSKGVIT